MNAQTPMSGPMPTSEHAAGRQAAESSQALRILALAAVCLGVAALAAATFVLSYSALRDVARQAGVAPRLTRGYPLIIDAMLVIVLAAVLALRGARLPSRLAAWLSLLAVLAAAAGADALHMAKHRLPARPAQITAAVLPWALVFIAFALLLLMLRHFRLRRQAPSDGGAAPGEVRPVLPPAVQQLPAAARPALALPARPPAPPASIVPGLTPGQAAPAEAQKHTWSEPAGLVPESDLAMDSELPPDDPSSDEAAAGIGPDPVSELAPPYGETSDSAPAESTAPADTGPDDSAPDDSTAPADTAPDDSAVPADDAAPDDPAGPAPEAAGTEDEQDPEMPVFHRMWSSPTPPAEE